MDYQFFKNLAFRFDPESIHDMTFNIFHYFPKTCSHFFTGVKKVKNGINPYQVKGSHFTWPFPVGVAAGLDKDAVALDYFNEIGFGNIEVGTVTPLEQGGNEKPRIFRYPKNEALRNSMGFPNKGKDEILLNLKKYHEKHQRTSQKMTIAVNIGANKENAFDEKIIYDLKKLYQTFAPYSQFLVINLSSPNTQNLRSWQKKEGLKTILHHLDAERKETPCPLFIKIAPDLSAEEVSEIVTLVKEFSLDGIVATNTTIDHGYDKGGISGAPLYEKARTIRLQILEEIKECPKIDLIGVGGFFTFEQILDFWKHGGKFVQIYTSFIYKGPEFLREVQLGIDHLLLRKGMNSLEEYFASRKC